MRRKTNQALRNQTEWNSETWEAFQREIYEIGAQVKAQIGPKDLAYLKKVKRLSRLSEILGRALLHVSLDPFTWSAGVLALWVHLQIETAEIGHSALHGCWDGLKGAEKFSSTAFKWDTPVDERSWQHEHNILHHQYANVVGRDPDLNYGDLRVAEQTPWMPYHLIQLAQVFWTAPFFLWVIATYATGLTDLFHPKKESAYAPILPDRKIKTLLSSVKRTTGKMVPYALYHFVFWPLLAGPFWWKVLGGNIAADLIRNVYTAATIYAGHFGDDLKYHDRSFQAHSRGEWFKAQIEAAHDYKVPYAVSLLCGALDCQIEHHLFPKLPPNRLREIAPRIRAVCEKYGVPYNKVGWGKTLEIALKRLARMSFSKTQTQG